MSKEDRARKFMLWLLLLLLSVLVAIEFLSMLRWILYPFYPSTPYEDSSWWSVHLETKLFYFPASLAPLIFTVTIFLWVIVPLQRYIGRVRVRVRIGQRMTALCGGRNAGLDHSVKPGMFGRRFSVLALVCSIALTSFLAIYPYLPSLNPEGRYIGIDIPAYEQLLSEMDESDGLNVVPYAFFIRRDRPLSLVLMFEAHKITGSSLQTVLKFMPLLLGPLLILAMFYFVLEATGDRIISSLTALLAAFSYHVTGGMLGALFSNWIALIGVFLFSGLLMRSMKKRSWPWVSLTASTMVSVLFTHAYTWGILMGVLGIYTLLLVIRGILGENIWWKFKAVGAIILGNVIVDFVRNWLLGSAGGVATEVVGVAKSRFALDLVRIGRFWTNLNWTLQKAMGGFYMNFVVLFLALIGAFLVCLRDKPVHRYLASWLMLSSVLFMLGDGTIQWRILYDLPISIFAAFGLDYIRRRLASLGSREAKVLVCLCILLVVLVNANYGFRCAHHLIETFSFI